MFCVSPLSLHPVRLNSGQYLWGETSLSEGPWAPWFWLIISTPRFHSFSLHPNFSLSWREHKCAGISIPVLQIPPEPAGLSDLRVPLLYCYTPCSGFQTHEFWISSNFYLFSVGKRKSSTSCSQLASRYFLHWISIFPVASKKYQFSSLPKRQFPPDGCECLSKLNTLCMSMRSLALKDHIKKKPHIYSSQGPQKCLL